MKALPRRQSNHSPRLRNCGFTLIELLTVIAIIGILAGILIPAISKVRTQSAIAQRTSKIRQIQLASISYSNENNGRYLPVRVVPNGSEVTWSKSYPRWFASEEFKDYMGEGGKFYTDDTDLQDPGVTERMDMGWNRTDLWTNRLAFSKTKKFSFSSYDVKKPTRLIAFAETNDWMVDHKNLGIWDQGIEEKGFNNMSGNEKSAPAFRSNGKMLVVTFDGSVSQLTPEEAADRSRWSNQ